MGIRGSKMTEEKTYHSVVDQIKRLLSDNNFWFECFEHQPVKTSEEAAKVRTGYSLEQGAKAIIVKVENNDKEKKFVMLVFPANLKFDNKKVKQLLNIKDIRFATEQEAYSITDGVELGGVPPFGNLFGLEVIVDPKLLVREKVIFNAGDRKVSIAMDTKDYQKLVKPRLADIT